MYITGGPETLWLDVIAQKTTDVTVESQYRTLKYSHNIQGSYVFWDVRNLQDRPYEAARAQEYNFRAVKQNAARVAVFTASLG